MNVYKRYFRIDSPELQTKIVELLNYRNEYFKKARKLAKKLGAHDVYSGGTCISGFGFKNGMPPEADKINWKLAKNCSGEAYFPKKNTERGREILKLIAALGPEPQQPEAVLEDLVPGCQVGLITGHRMYRTVLYGAESKGWFVQVPWADADPKELERYRKNKAKDKAKRKLWMDHNLDHLLWVAPTDWTELKEWEVLRSLDKDKGLRNAS